MDEEFELFSAEFNLSKGLFIDVVSSGSDSGSTGVVSCGFCILLFINFIYL